LNKYYIYILSFIVFFTACGRTNYVYKEKNIISHPYSAPQIDASTKQAYIDAVNTMRSRGRRCGNLGYFPAVPPLRWNNALYRAAYEHSNDMAETDNFMHQGSATQYDWTMHMQHLTHGSTFTERIENNGYIKWRRLGQNIAAGMPDVSQTMKQWETSSHHCKNIMDGDFTTFGMAHVYKHGTMYRDYWTQNFAMHQ
jgi:uncharacterized protein YkwD